MRISIIAAMSINRVIGKGDGLPWHLPADLRYFKEKTMDHAVIMGRRTFDTVGKPLPGRRNIVVSHRRDLVIEGAEVVHSVLEALKGLPGEEEVFIAGGGEIYRQSLDLADRLYLTMIHAEFEGDTFFPEFDETNWRLTSRTDQPSDERNPWEYSFLVYDRK
jgi:dihydrofolate reductase